MSRVSAVPRFTRAELESYRDAEVPDLAGPGMRLLFVGINPGLMTAATGIHFGNPGNRFRPALVAARLLAPLDGRPARHDRGRPRRPRSRGASASPTWSGAPPPAPTS